MSTEKESTMQKTLTIGPHPHQLLANAILHLTNVFTTEDLKSTLSRISAARELVQDIAFPDHAERPAPAPAPSCDAPHCACAEGEDCHANGAAAAERVVVGVDLNRYGLSATAWTLSRVDCTNVGDVLRLSDGREVVQFAIPAAMDYDAMKDALHMVWCELDVLAGKARHTQQHEADRVMIRAVEPSYPGPADGRGTWVLDPDATGHRAPFAVGDLVVRSSGRAGIHQVVAVSVDWDAPRHRSLHLKVEPQDVVVDRDAI